MAITHRTGAILSNSDPIIINTIRSGVACKDGADENEAGEADIEDSVDLCIPDDQPQQEQKIRVAIDDGVEECSELCHPFRAPRDLAVNDVENAGEHDDQSRPQEYSLGEQDHRK